MNNGSKPRDADSRLTLLLDLGKSLNLGFDLDKLLVFIARRTAEILEADRATLFLVDPRRRTLWSRVALGEDRIEVPIDSSLVGHSATTGETLNIPDVTKDPRHHAAVDQRTGYRTCCVLCLPMRDQRGQIFGVFQVLNKLAGTFTPSDEELLSAIAPQAAMLLENARLHQQLVQERLQEQEMAHAQEIQRSFLPRELPAFKGYQFAAHYAAARQVAGDFYDFVPLLDNQMGIAVGDVSGKGMPAALLMARLTAQLQRQWADTPEPHVALSQINNLLVSGAHEEMFATLFLLTLEEGTGNVRAANAGHPPPLIVRKDGRVEPATCPGGPEVGLPAGLFAGTEYPASSFELEPGDQLLVYTDGLIDACNLKGERFERERLLASLSQPAASAEDRLSTLLHTVESFVEGGRGPSSRSCKTGRCGPSSVSGERGRPQADDTTLVVVARHQGPAKRAGAERVE